MTKARRVAAMLARMLAVTRELKLALIVGFSLVLVVTVLISDHLSRARTSTLEPTLSQTPPLTPRVDPETVTQANDGSGVFARQTPTEPTGPGAIQPNPNTNGNPAGNTQPVELTMGRTTPPTGEASDLERAVRALGGEIRDGRVYLPPAAGMNPPSGTLPETTPSSQANTNGTTPSYLTPLGPTPIVPNTPPPAPAATPDRIYTVVAGDSAYKIAKRELGDGEMWRTLVSYNKGVIPESGTLREGMKIKLPPKKDVAGTNPAKNSDQANAAPKTVSPPPVGPSNPTTAKFRNYVIKKGDTLGTIASRELGTVRRLQELLDLNKGVLTDPDVAPLGKTIKLPLT